VADRDRSHRSIHEALMRLRSALPELFSLSFTLASLLAFGSEQALAAPRRLTDNLGSGCAVASPSPNDDATLVAFASDCDFLGTNLDANREIFQVDRAGVVVQLTNTTDCSSANPSSNAAGDIVAFDSDCDTGMNSDGNVEIFIASPTAVAQVTDTMFCTSLAPSVSANGALVSFDSDCDLTGANLDRSVEIFRSLLVGGSAEQLTDDRSVTGCASINATSDASGGAIAFESDCDLTGENADQVNEIFAALGGSTVEQVTSSPGEPCANVTPAMASDGSTIAFASDCDLVAENVDLSSEIFIAPAGSDPIQLTSDAGTSGCESLAPSVAVHAGAERTVFLGYCNPTGDNDDGSLEVFREMGGVTTQLTESESCWNTSPKIAAEGDAVVFVSNCDLTGSDSNGQPDLYLEQACACGAPNGREGPTATEALFALNAAVGTLDCALCDCDVNGDARLSAFDALLILNKGIGQPVELNCP
jgi:Tol biopolymer transport system component